MRSSAFGGMVEIEGASAIDTVADRPASKGASWYVLALLTLIYASQFMDRQLVSVLVEPIRHEFALNDTEIGFLIGMAYGIPFAVVILPMGAIIDRANRRNLLALLVSLWSVFTVLSGLARSFIVLLLARIAVAATEAPNTPAAFSIIADLFGPERRATAVGIYYTGTALGTVIAFALGGFIAADYGWRTAFFLGGIPGLVLAALMLLSVREPARERVVLSFAHLEIPTFPQTLRFMWSCKPIVHLLGALMLTAIAVSGHTMWMAPFLTRTYDLPLRVAGLAIGLGFGIACGIGQAFGGTMADWFARGKIARIPWVAAVSTALVAPLMIATALASRPFFAVGAMALWGMANGMQYGPVIGTCQSLVPPRMRGRMSAVLMVLTNLIGAGVGSQLTGILSDLYAPWAAAHSLRWALVTVSGFELWASVHFARAAIMLRRNYGN